ncbi:MAG: DUF512 domain-containing protein [Thermoleophilia bacterium]
MKTSSRHQGGVVDSVEVGSPAGDAGILAGDIIVSLNGQPLHDVIDYQFYLESGLQRFEVERDGKRLEIEADCGDVADPGILFKSVIFDRVRTCSNRCVFCFIDQVPAGLRQPLYLKDDDFRLSFLHGNFITLNNLSREDMERIIAQRLSPLHVSVHSTDAEVRGRLMGCGAGTAARGLDNLRRLGEAGIELHAQVVFCPGLNDGKVLERTAAELSEIYRGIKSVGVVPVALGESHFAQKVSAGVRPVTVADCRDAIGAIAAMQQQFRLKEGKGFVYAADEFFLKSGSELPPVEYYDDFSQYENGIGIARSFLEEAEAAIGDRLAEAAAAGRVFLLTGVLAAELVASACDRFGRSLGREFLPLVAENELFGFHVTVTGLLGGRDVIRAASGCGLRRTDLLLIPSLSLDSAGERFLDDISLEELHEALDCGIEVV